MCKLLLSMMLICLSLEVAADSIRCGRKIVKTGDSVNILIKKCGNPQRKFTGKEIINEGGRQSKMTVSNWVYDRARKHDMIVAVRSGIVVKIQVE